MVLYLPSMLRVLVWMPPQRLKRWLHSVQSESAQDLDRRPRDGLLLISEADLTVARTLPKIGTHLYRHATRTSWMLYKDKYNRIDNNFKTKKPVDIKCKMKKWSNIVQMYNFYIRSSL